MLETEENTLALGGIVMGFGEAIKICFSKYFTFSGRARRSEYWWFYLFTILLSIVAGIFDGMLGFGSEDLGILGTIATLITIIPSLSAQVRRLHDTGRSGWWIGGALIAVIIFVLGIVGAAGISGLDGTGADAFGGPVGIFMVIFIIAFIIYGIAMLVFMCQDSHEGDNKYGPSPKYGSGASVFD